MSAGVGAKSLVLSLAQQLQSWAGSMLSRVGDASDTALTLAAARTQGPGRKAAVEKAAGLLRDLRQAAGLSLEELGQALELDDPSFMGLVESGKVGLPFDLILRLASVLARNDPVGFVMKMTRTYNPKIWKTLDALGVGKLLVQAGREREFANIYRRHDAARHLSDKDFGAALAFADAAFQAALVFQLKHKRGTHSVDASGGEPPPPTE
ncbi:MAG: helix-turn-helix transcriptional regulator [Betaproteobacteria bacterium]|nr:helix-turn-helix transcriptional regulator [Betaproteobacteria bacterium]